MDYVTISVRKLIRLKKVQWCVGIMFMLLLYPGTFFHANAQNSSEDYLTSVQNNYSQFFIDLELDEVPLDEALRKVAQQARIGLSFDSDIVPEKVISAKFDQTYIYHVLSDLLEGTNLMTEVAPNGRSLIVKEREAGYEAVQETVTGQVTDASTGEPLPGVNIQIAGTTRGVSTDGDGFYEISVDNLQETLVFTFIGYRPLEVALDGRSELNVTLEMDVIEGEGLLVVAFGAVNREEFVGSATQVTARQFEQRAITNATQIVEGASPGVLISPGSGQPGSSPRIRVRGIGSVGTSNEPLIVVDGAIFTGQLASINPGDIESLTVLKDAASTSLYGSGAANGVIMITTKQGRQEGQVDVRMSQGVVTRSVPEYDRVNAMQYYPLFWEALKNKKIFSDGLDDQTAREEASAEVFDVLAYNPFGVPTDQIVMPDGSLNPSATLMYDDNWQDELMRTGLRSNMEIAYSGQIGNTNYYTSIGYLNETGYIINSDFERLNARLNINSRPRDWFRTGLNLSGATSESNAAVDGVSSSSSFVNPYRATRLMGPIYPLYERDRFTGELIEGGTYDFGDNRPEASGRHAVWENILNEDLRKDTNLNVRTFADFYFLDDFTFTVNATFDRRYNNRERARNAIIGDAAPGGDAYRYGYVYTGITFNQLLNYQTRIQDHNIQALAGHESFQYERDYTFMRRQQQVVEGNTELINYVNLMSGTSNKREYRKEGFFTRLSYDYASTYYISGSLRYDGSSRFRDDVRWATFWSLGGAWRLDQEDFIRNIDWISSLKLRASYGEVGNDSHTSHAGLSFYAYQALYELGYNNASEAGILLGTAGNPNLVWEANAQTDVALEFDLFRNRLSGTIEWYHRETSDLLFDVPLPLSSGITDYPDNVGTMYNRGVELTFDVSLIRTREFQWNTLVQASTLTNRFRSLPQEEIITGTKKLMKGRSIYDYWLRQWYGVDPADGSALYIATEEAIAVGGSDIREVDGVMVTTNQNNAEYGYVGTAIPDLFGSITNSFSYRGFTLSALLTYQIGGKTYDSNYALLMHPGSADGRAMSTDILDRWQQPGDITNVPRLDADQASAFNAASSRWLVSSDYLALRNMNLSYAFDPAFIQQFGVRNASVYVNAENLTALTARKGLEPIQQFNGTTQPRYTPSRVVTLGVNLTF